MLAKGLLLSTLLLISTPVAAIKAHEMRITRAQWPQHVNGYSVLAVPAIEQTLRLFVENGKFNIVIRYPGGDPGRRWAVDVYNWLVSFGVPFHYMELELGADGPAQLDVHVIDRS